MEKINIKNLTFEYPLNKNTALKNINLKINAGEYVVICGRSGCGKTTLLRHLKPALTPKGKRDGEILFDGEKTENLGKKNQASLIGFVMQDPENQIVTDKVWHEIAFGLESIGLKEDEIRLRAAEMSAYFGIEDWFGKKTDELSGGEKQLMNLAAIMAMHPEVLILDEPTSQLDPVAAENFLSTVNRINKELGVTIIITEHRLEEVFVCADRAVVMDGGEIVCDLPPQKLCDCPDSVKFIRDAMPAAMKIYSAFPHGEKMPVSVKDGRMWLGEILKEKSLEVCREKEAKENDAAIELKHIFFRYEKDGEDVLKDLNLKIPERSFTAIMGGNGAGKSTLLKILCGVLKPYRGKVKFGKKNLSVAMLPQDAKLVFTEKNVLLDLKRACKDEEEIKKVCELTKIQNLLDRHPYDLSGGERQRAATALLLLKKSDILLFDEPTKGMDCEFKQSFAKIIGELIKEGRTVIAVSHDVEFCAEYADACAMIFDGETACIKNTREFFLSNVFYTTSVCRMTRGIIKNAVLPRDVINCLKEK